MKVKYCVVKEIYEAECTNRVSYGICAYRLEDNALVVVEAVYNLSDDYEKINKLCAECNKSELEADHLKDVADDFLALC
ncbi:MAG: hypothetical protein IJZ93_03250 [Clostridia bacterium]|nr:hypothetical protein [Clostridia bacterium]